jgi:hypothetical protein
MTEKYLNNKKQKKQKKKDSFVLELNRSKIIFLSRKGKRCEIIYILFSNIMVIEKQRRGMIRENKWFAFVLYVYAIESRK